MHTSIYMRAYMNTWMHRTTQALPDSGCCLSRDLEGMDAFREWSPGFNPQRIRTCYTFKPKTHKKYTKNQREIPEIQTPFFLAASLLEEALHEFRLTDRLIAAGYSLKVATSSFEATGRSEVSSLRPTTADSTRETRNATTSSLGATSNASTSRSYTSTSRESSQGTMYSIALYCFV